MKNRFKPTRAAIPRNIFLFFLFGTELKEGTVNEKTNNDMIHEHAI